MTKLQFENLDDTHYITTKAAVKEYAIFSTNFKDVLGYDETTEGSVAFKKGINLVPYMTNYQLF
ncbi:MAG: hypothetical protein U5L45_03305 [Saprospiraceae bacterium]|nr:hypothetical protein [Saprospiraceae bacterium]